jgi:hypothetical protein
MGKVVHVQPRRFAVHHKGFHGFVEFKPSDKTWEWTLKLQTVIKQHGVQDSKEAAVLELKQFIEVATQSKTLRSID